MFETPELELANATDQLLGIFAESSDAVWYVRPPSGGEYGPARGEVMQKWLAEGRRTEDGPALKAQERHFTARFKGSIVKDMKEVAAALKSGTAQLADARSATRFRGEEVEPRPGVRAGHMPGAMNVHYASLLNPDGTLKSPDAIAAAFASAGVDLGKPVITSCGSGVTAAILTLGLTLAGTREHALYDGSWTEWGGNPDAPVATGA